MILAMVSDVFYGQFYGSMSESRDIIEINDSTHEAFKIMIEFTYSKTPDWMKFTKLELYFDVYKLADFYLMEKLKSVLSDAVKNIVITETNFNELSSCADRNGQFEKLSSSVFENCALFLSQSYGSYEKILELIRNHKGDSVILMKILRMIKVSEVSENSKCVFGYFYKCLDCTTPTHFTHSTICKPCIERCHAGHNISEYYEKWFYCDCETGLLVTEEPCRVISE